MPDVDRRYRFHGAAFLVGLVLGIAAYARIGPGAASIDAGVQAALLLLVGVVLASTAGAAGAIFAATTAATEARLAREDAANARNDDRTDARRDRFADRKLSLAVDLLVAADEHRREADALVAEKWDRFRIESEVGDVEWTEPLPKIGKTEGIRTAYLALEIAAPGASSAAGRLYEVSVPLGHLAATWEEPHRYNEYAKEWSAKWNAATEAWDAARRDFSAAVRADLGVG